MTVKKRRGENLDIKTILAKLNKKPIYNGQTYSQEDIQKARTVLERIRQDPRRNEVSYTKVVVPVSNEL